MARQQYSVSLTPEEKAFVQELGGGSISRGLREAVARARATDSIHNQVAALRKEMKDALKRLETDYQQQRRIMRRVYSHTLLARLDIAETSVASKRAKSWLKDNGAEAREYAKRNLREDLLFQSLGDDSESEKKK